MESSQIRSGFKDHYKVEKEIGSGSFAVVKKGVNKQTGEKVAIKVIKKQGMN
jgi:serine/threonine protein kinase